MRDHDRAPAAELAMAAEITYYRAHMQDGRDPDSVAVLRRGCAQTLRATLPGPLRELELGVMTDVLLASLRFVAFPDARPALEQARSRGERVIVVSNWDASLPEVLDAVGLGDLVDGVVSSATAGAGKPGAAIFLRALGLAGVMPGQALHVGDSLEEDVAGAVAAGVPALWLNRAGVAVPPGVTAIGSLTEICGRALTSERAWKAGPCHPSPCLRLGPRSGPRGRRTTCHRGRLGQRRRRWCWASASGRWPRSSLTSRPAPAVRASTIPPRR